MGIQYKIVNLTKRELLDSPHASEEWEWNMSGLSARVVLWALWTRWNGDKVAVFHNCGGPADYEKNCVGWPNVWPEVWADYRRRHGLGTTRAITKDDIPVQSSTKGTP